MLYKSIRKEINDLFESKMNVGGYYGTATEVRIYNWQKIINQTQ